MATKALVVSALQQNYPKPIGGGLKLWIGTMKGPTLYANGGVRVNVGRGFGGLRFIHSIICHGAVDSGGTARYIVNPTFDFLATKPIDIQATTPALLLSFTNTLNGAEAGAVDLSTFQFRVE